MLWDALDNSKGYYKCKFDDQAYRSRINTTFRILGGHVEAEQLFIDEAKKAGIVQIKGHPFNPGVRISMYNSMPIQGISYLTNFMRLFMKKYPSL